MNDPKVISSMNENKPRRNRKAYMRFVAVPCVGIAFVFGLAARLSPAQTTMELTRWKEFSYAKETKQTGGPMTTLNAVNRSGFVLLSEGQFARLSSWCVHTSSPEGKEFYQGFVMYDFQDGSSILAKVDASGQPRAKQIGTIMFIAGTKRFKGITGRGTITSWMPTPWDMYTEIDATYSVSDR